jgi:hypothetical protein
MNTTTQNAETQNTMRNRSNGRYTYSSKFERVCTCGRCLAAHDAEAPHAFGDYVLDSREGLPDCDKFVWNRKASPEVIEAAIVEAKANKIL